VLEAQNRYAPCNRSIPFPDLEGMLASLGPGLRTVSGVNKSLGGMCLLILLFVGAALGRFLPLNQRVDDPLVLPFPIHPKAERVCLWSLTLSIIARE
jgi:hypothetical protein